MSKDAAVASPGPWRWFSKGEKTWIGTHLIDASGQDVIGIDYGTPIENAADAELIRSAPEMLALLRELEFSGTGRCPCCTEVSHHDHDCRLGGLLDRLERE